MSDTLSSRYNALRNNGSLKPDHFQENAVHLLSELQGKLKHYQERDRGGFWPFGQKATVMPQGLYLYGGVGRGKSMLMDMFFETCPAGIRKERTHFHNFMLEVHDALHTYRKDKGNQENGQGIDRFARAVSQRTTLLCFDEFFVTNVADAMILGRLFSSLFKKGLIFVMTSNRHPDSLYEGGLQRKRFLPFIDLLKDKMTIVPVEGEQDYRTMDGEQIEEGYFTPLNRRTFQEIENRFINLSKGKATEEIEFTIKGRVFKVKAAGNVARFDFAELCERPVGTEDYLHLAKNFDVIFIENVPRMGYDRRNEASRFMNLIDVLFDQEKKVVISAEQPPEKLYFGHEHAFEFQRTVSRLKNI